MRGSPMRDPHLAEHEPRPESERQLGDNTTAAREVAYAVEDLTKLAHCTVEAVVSALQARALQGDIYSRCGPLLVAVNPYRQLPLYGQGPLERYLTSTQPTTLAPHVYGTGAAVVQAFRMKHRSQAVVVSGESGAGKTETCKRLLEFLSAASAKGSSGSRNMHARVIETNPMLESLGCARTLRNDNSSRYGKFIAIRHDASGGVRAANIETFLLEKSRVTRRGEGEDNFHVFYELVAGAPSSMQRDFQLASVPRGGWGYLSKAQHRQLDDDRRNFDALCKGLAAVGFTAAASNELLGTLAAVLWLGQVNFLAATDANGEECAVIADEQALRIAAMLLGGDASDLGDALCIRCIKAGNDWVKSHYSPAQSRSVRDGFAQAIYAGVFKRVVEQANRALVASSATPRGEGDSATPNDATRVDTPRGDLTPRAPVAEAGGTHIGLLDIFGFEALGSNSLEQLCINFANEKLQDLFVTIMIERTQALYAAEGVEFDAAAVPAYDRSSMALMKAVFRLLTEECVLLHGSDAQLLDKLLCAHGDHPSFNPAPAAPGQRNGRQDQDGARRRQRMESMNTRSFVVAHFAGQVRYGVHGFLQKNKDPLSQDLIILMQWSVVPLLKRIFGVGSSGTSSSKFHGVVERFLVSLRSLMMTLESADVHFIRCIKPNEAKRPHQVDAECVSKQVLSSGLVPAIGISRAGFSTHMPREQFRQTFGPAWARATGTRAAVPLDDAQLVGLLAWVGAAPREYCVGKTCVFLRHGVLDRLELLQYGGLEHYVTMLQSVARRRLAKALVQKMRQELRKPPASLNLATSIGATGSPRALESSAKPLRKGDSFERRVHIRKKLDAEDEVALTQRRDSFERKRQMFGGAVKTRGPPKIAREDGERDALEVHASGGEVDRGPDSPARRALHGQQELHAAADARADPTVMATRTLRSAVGGGDARVLVGFVPQAEEERRSELDADAPYANDEALRALVAAEVAAQGLRWPLEYVLEYADFMGMQLPEDADLLWIADEALNEGEQPDWEECLDIRGGLYYQHRITGTVLTQHPIDYHYQRYYFCLKVNPEMLSSLDGGHALLMAHRPASCARSLSAPRSSPAQSSAHLRQTMPRSFQLLHFETVVSRSAEHGLGIQVKRGNVIIGIKDGIDTELQVGDRITGVDGVVLQGNMSIASAIEMAAEHELAIERWVPEYEQVNLARSSSTVSLPSSMLSPLSATGSRESEVIPPSPLAWQPALLVPQSSPYTPQLSAGRASPSSTAGSTAWAATCGSAGGLPASASFTNASVAGAGQPPKRATPLSGRLSFSPSLPRLMQSIGKSKQERSTE